MVDAVAQGRLRPHGVQVIRSSLTLPCGRLTRRSGIDAGIKLRPSARDLEILGPEFEEHWQRVFANAPDKPISWFSCDSLWVTPPCSAT